MRTVVRAGAAVATAALTWCILAIAPGCHGSSPKTERICSEGQALQSGKLRGNGLPPKTIALTFDDGPGIRTLELSHYLKAEGIRAAFFVMGKNVPPGEEGVALLRALVDDGHVIGNHTWTHPDLTTVTPEQIVAELTQTDALIAPFVSDRRFLFRPPYGAWNDAVLSALAASPMNKYAGPVDWDLGYQMGDASAADWDCWSPSGVSDPPVIDVATCGALYLEQIRTISSGVVLMHDPYFIGDKAANGGTVDMVKAVVPALKADGFTFVRIDEVPSVAAALAAVPPPAPPTSVDASVDAAIEIATPIDPIPTADAATASSTATTDQHALTPGGDSSDPCSSSPQALVKKR